MPGFSGSANQAVKVLRALYLYSRVHNLVLLANSGDGNHRRAGVLGDAVHGQCGLPDRDGPDVEVVDIGHSGYVVHLPLDLLPFDAPRDSLEEDVGGRLEYPRRRVEDDEREENCADWVGYLPVRLPPDQETCEENSNRLN